MQREHRATAGNTACSRSAVQHGRRRPAAGGAAKAAVQSQIYGPGNVNDGTFGADEIGRIKSFFVNGPQTDTDGVDIFVKYEDAYADGIMAVGVEAAYVIDYSVSAYSKGGSKVPYSESG